MSLEVCYYVLVDKNAQPIEWWVSDNEADVLKQAQKSVKILKLTPDNAFLVKGKRIPLGNEI